MVATLVSPVTARASSARPRGPWPFGEFFDAMVLLHRGLAGRRGRRCSPSRRRTLVGDLGGSWRAWYAGVWAEAGVLAGLPERAERLRRADGR